MSNGVHKAKRGNTVPTSQTRLIRLVARLGSPAVARAPTDFAARLGRLFDLSDTIVLDDATRRTAHQPPAPARQRYQARQQLAADLADSRDALAQAIAEAFESDAVSEPLPPPQAARKPGIPPAFEPYARFYQARQRLLTARVQRLRARARAIVSEADPALVPLAELDAVFDNTLTAYRRQCHEALPAVLEKRFRALWRAHHRALPAETPDPPAEWLREGAWLDRFQQEMRLLLLAELEARLIPVQGLLDALTVQQG